MPAKCDGANPISHLLQAAVSLSVPRDSFDRPSSILMHLDDKITGGSPPEVEAPLEWASELYQGL